MCDKQKKNMKLALVKQPEQPCLQVPHMNSDKKKIRCWIVILGIGVVLILLLLEKFVLVQKTKKFELSTAVLQYQPVVEQYASEYKIYDYLPYLLAIMQVESGGIGMDVMQCSESLGLPPNTLASKDSIQQGCRYFSELIDVAEKIGCDLESVIQAYNYGIGYLYYVAEHGNKHTAEIAENFAQKYSDNTKVAYDNPIAVSQNGGWRYQYGNMFYTKLIHQYIKKK